MKIYLTQHGEALAKEIDPERPLSDRGRDDVTRMAKFLAAAGITLGTVRHSGKLRARQTAELLAAALGPGATVEPMEGLNPKDSGDGLLTALEAMSEDLLVAGHQPFMGRFVSRLLSCRDEPATVAYQPGSVVCLERDQEGLWTLQWMIRPRLLGEDSVTR